MTRAQGYYLPAVYFVIAMFVCIGAFEWWASATQHATISQWVWWAYAQHFWVALLVIGGTGFLMYHFFWKRRGPTEV